MSLDAGRVGVRADQVDIHGRVTSPSFLNELLEDLPEWTDMPVWVNGTEELLPSDNSVPVTSPILADIAYPDVRRDNQYFTYRESPTPVDGLAKIKSIKGNTLVWNQLRSVTEGSVTTAGVTRTYSSDGKCTFTGTSTSANVFNVANNIPAIPNHKYLILFDKSLDGYRHIQVRYSADGTVDSGAYLGSIYTPYIFTYTNSQYPYILVRFFYSNGITVNDSFYLSVYDLTKMGLDSITSVEEFTSLFSLPYYAYNQGTLLSFMGNGIKTVGKNLLNNTATSGSVSGLTYTVNEDKSVTVNGTHADSFTVVLGINMDVHSGEQLILAGAGDGSLSGYFLRYAIRDKNGTALPIIGNMVLVDLPTDEQAITVPNGAAKLWCYIAVNGNITLNNKTFYPMVRFADVQDSSYEPYTSSTLSLPISTYFPNGMKSAGNVYDELTPTKAITRIGAVDLGSLNWTYLNDGIFRTSAFPNVKTDYIPKWFTTADYQVASTTDYTGWKTRNMQMGFLEGYQFIIFMNTSLTDATAFKESLNGVYLYYELATPVELPTLSLGE